MKKLVLFLSVLLILTGCGNKVKCTKTSKDGKSISTAIGTFKKDKLTSIKFIDERSFKNPIDAENVCNTARDAANTDKTIKVSCKKKTVIVTIEKEVKNSSTSKEGFKKEYSSYKCK